MDLQALRSGGVRNPNVSPILFEGQKFATEDRKFHFVTQVDFTIPTTKTKYPFTLGSFSTTQAQSSQWSRVIDDQPLELQVNPQAVPWAKDGDLAWLQSRQGKLQVRIKKNTKLRTDIVCIPKGGWLKAGQAANSLVQARTTDDGLGAAYYDEPELPIFCCKRFTHFV